MLVIEANQSDLTRGFTQLAAELAALELRSTTQGEILYGAVTTGDLWRFGQDGQGDYRRYDLLQGTQ
jgi:hypothetical protein